MWRVITIGNLTATSPYDGACRDYQQRIKRYAAFELLELKPQKGGDTQSILKKEAQLLQPYLPASSQTILLDERGKHLTTLELTRWLARQPDWTFVIGSAWGLHVDIKCAAPQQLALSALTLPHELARVVLLEQLYRVLTILAGHPYHHP